MNQKSKIKNILWIIFVAVFVVVAIVWIFASPRPEHIEDTNGADNYSLQTITEQDVVQQKMGTRGSVNKRETRLGNISSGIKYSSKKFTGVHQLYMETIFKGSDIYVSLAEFEIKEGNFAFYVVFDGEVIGMITPSDAAASEFTFENIEKTGDLEYVIAGESASFEFIALSDW